MKNLHLISTTLIIYLLFSFGNTIQAQWTRTAGPVGGEVYCIEKVGNEIWASTNDGIYTSSDEGENWKVHPEFDNILCFGITAIEDTIFVLYTYNDDSFESSYSVTSLDGGRTWSQESLIEINAFNPSYSKVYWINGAFYDLNFALGGFVTYDYGDTWTEFSPNGDKNTYSYSVSVNEKGILYTRGFPNSDTSQIFYYKGPEDPLIVINHPYEYTDVFLIDTTIFIVAGNSDTYRFEHLVKSDDYGVTWDTVYSPTVEASMSPYLYYFGLNIYLVDNINFFESTDNGKSWIRLDEEPIYFKYLRHGDYVETSQGNYLNHLFPLGIIKVSENPETYEVRSNGLVTQAVSFLETYKNVLYASNLYEFYSSTDSGNSWELFNPHLNNVKASAFSGDTILFLNDHYHEIAIVRSFDGGQSWDSIPVNYNLGFNGRHSIVFAQNELYLNFENGIIRSKDLGITWDLMEPWSVSGNSNCPLISGKTGVIANIRDTLYNITNRRALLKYDKDNSIWNSVFCFTQIDINDRFKFKELDSSIIVVFGQNTFFYSENGSDAIYPEMNGLSPLILFEDLYAKELISYKGKWICSFENAGVYYTTDKGNNWIRLTNKDDFIPESGLVFTDGFLYAGSKYSGVWKRNIKTVQIHGQVFLDTNINGINDPGEKPLEGIIVKNHTTKESTATDKNGFYSLLSDQEGDTLTITTPLIFQNFTPSYQLSDFQNNKDFGIVNEQPFEDMSVDLSINKSFRPSLETELTITIQNKGHEPNSTLVTLNLDPKLSLIEATPAEINQTGDTYYWQTGFLSYLETTRIKIKVKTLASIYDTIMCSVNIDIESNETEIEDNFAFIKEEALHSFVPINKKCLQGKYFKPEQVAAGEELQYLIQFTNTEHWPYPDIKITDYLDKNLDLSTLRIIAASHDVTWDLNDAGELVFNFDEINLDGGDFNMDGDAGFIKYGIQCKKDVKLYEWIYNEAEFYFNVQDQFVTNKVATQITDQIILGTIEHSEPRENAKLLVYPNPTNDFLTIDTRGLSKDRHNISIIDINGKRILNSKITRSENQIQLNNLIPGIYFGIVSNENGERVGSFRFVFK